MPDFFIEIRHLIYGSALMDTPNKKLSDLERRVEQLEKKVRELEEAIRRK